MGPLTKKKKKSLLGVRSSSVEVPVSSARGMSVEHLSQALQPKDSGSH